MLKSALIACRCALKSALLGRSSMLKVPFLGAGENTRTQSRGGSRISEQEFQRGAPFADFARLFIFELIFFLFCMKMDPPLDSVTYHIALRPRLAPSTLVSKYQSLFNDISCILIL